MQKTPNAPRSPDDAAATVRDPLTAERIVAAAIELMDRDGMAALTMRKLGAHLSVQAMSLYGYFPNKEALLAAAGGALFGTIPDPAPGVDAFDGLRQVMVSFAQLVEEHPSTVDLLFKGMSVPVMDERGETDRAALRSVGFVDDATFALMSLVSFVVGSLHQGRLVKPEDRRPAFEYGLDVVLNGLRLEAERRRKAANATG